MCFVQNKDAGVFCIMYNWEEHEISHWSPSLSARTEGPCGRRWGLPGALGAWRGSHAANVCLPLYTTFQLALCREGKLLPMHVISTVSPSLIQPLAGVWEQALTHLQWWSSSHWFSYTPMNVLVPAPGHLGVNVTNIFPVCRYQLCWHPDQVYRMPRDAPCHSWSGHGMYVSCFGNR